MPSHAMQTSVRSNSIRKSSRKFILKGNVLQEMRKIQQSPENQFKKTPFNRLVREIGEDLKAGLRFGGTTVDALMEASQDYITELFERTQEAAIHAGRTTILKKDLQFAHRQMNWHTQARV